MRLPSTAFRSLNHPSAPLDQMPNPTRGARSDDEHLILSSKSSQASIVKEDKKLLIDLREVISPYMMKLGFAAVPTVGFEQRREKIMKTATMSYIGERLHSEKEVNTSKPGPTQRRVLHNGFYLYYVTGEKYDTTCAVLRH